MKLLCCFLLALMPLALGYSQPLRADPSLECQESSQAAIKVCLSQTEARVEVALSTALRIAGNQAAELDAVTGRPEAVPALQKSQEAWVGYREAQCRFVGATFGGGSGTGIGIQNCRITLTRDRISELLYWTQ